MEKSSPPRARAPCPAGSSTAAAWKFAQMLEPAPSWLGIALLHGKEPVNKGVC